MRKRFVVTTMLPCCIAGILLPCCFGQAPTTADTAPPLTGALNSPQTATQGSLPRFGIAVSAGTLGAGIEAATAVARHTNIRGGFNYFSYSLSGTDSNNNLTYSGKIRPESGEILVDQYLAGPFHVSGGALIYDGFQASGTVHEPGGTSFTLNSVTYYSSPSDPVTGTGTIGVRKVAPELLFGFGNLLPRSARHFTAIVEFGVAFQGSPTTTLNLLGSTCITPTTGCAAISSSPTVQANVMAEQNKISNTLKPFQFYPIIRIGFGYKH
jgi:hypothetical protein